MTEITTADIDRVVMTQLDGTDPEEWLKKNGLYDVLGPMGTTIQVAVASRVFESGEEVFEAIRQIGLSCIQIGWELHREFGDRQ
jgi:hypothetical protein